MAGHYFSETPGVDSQVRRLPLHLPDRSLELDADRGVFSARTIVNAAGAWAEELARLAGAEAVGLRPMRRTICIIDVPPRMDCSAWPAVADVAESF